MYARRHHPADLTESLIVPNKSFISSTGKRHILIYDSGYKRLVVNDGQLGTFNYAYSYRVHILTMMMSV